MVDAKKTKFRQIYDALPPRSEVVTPKTAFVIDMAKLCKVTGKTVRGWIAGTYKPGALRISHISNKFGMPENKLL